MLLKVGQNVYRKVLLGLVLVEDSEDPEKEFKKIWFFLTLKRTPTVKFGKAR